MDWRADTEVEKNIKECLSPVQHTLDDPQSNVCKMTQAVVSMSHEMLTIKQTLKQTLNMSELASAPDQAAPTKDALGNSQRGHLQSTMILRVDFWWNSRGFHSLLVSRRQLTGKC